MRDLLALNAGLPPFKFMAGIRIHSCSAAAAIKSHFSRFPTAAASAADLKVTRKSQSGSVKQLNGNGEETIMSETDLTAADDNGRRRA